MAANVPAASPMLFNSYPFIFLFLPASILLTLMLGRWDRRAGTVFLAAASFFFYGWWDARYLSLLAGSILVNYLCALAILRRPPGTVGRRFLLWLGIAFDLVLLGFFKYADFLLGTVGELLGVAVPHLGITLPVGISFFTFTQIAFLVDTAEGKAEEYDLGRYSLFVTFFPHLLAGPLLHHKEMMPQFAAPEAWRPRAENFSVGLTIFVIGLAKKVVLADGIAFYANPLFEAAAGGAHPDLLQAWGGALAYTFQLYFDFSGYSDMAIGAARCFGIRLPLNFDSPYKSASISEFWRRWHMTLSRFLRDYLYVPLGGNRKGRARRYLNLFITMLLGGLWHGAAWNYVAWGALHGIYLAIHHAWQGVRARLGFAPVGSPLGRAAAVALTFLAVVIAWVLFRASSFAAALAILAGMAGLNGNGGPEHLLGVSYGAALYGGIDETLALAFLTLLAFCAPNTQQWLADYRPALPIGHGELPRGGRLRWTPQSGLAFAMVALLLLALSRMSGVSPFLYYQF